MTRTCEVIDGAIIYQLAQLQIKKTQAAKDGKLSKVRINKSTIDEFTILTDSFMDNLLQRLKRLTEVQRRRSPNVSDIELLLQEGIVDLSGLNESYDQCNLLQQLSPKREAQLSQIKSLGEQLERKTVLEPSNSLEWIDKVTKRKLTRDYIPKWMPVLPPEHTWKSSPRFTERVRDPKILRERLVVEGRLGEKALEHIVVNESQSAASIDSPIYEDVESDTSVESDNEEVKMVNGGGNFGFDDEDDDDEEEIDPLTGEPKPPKKKKVEDKKFDIVEFANNRIKMLEKKRELEERRINKRLNSETSKWGKTLGSYTSLNEIPDSLPLEFTHFKKRKYQQLISGLRRQEIKCSQWMKSQDEKRLLLEEERKKLHGANEIQVGMPMANPAIDQMIPQLEEQQLAMVTVDEELEFDMDFSDIEEMETDSSKLPTTQLEIN